MGNLVIAEHDGAELKGSTLNAVTAAAEIGGDIDILVAGSGCGAVAEAAAQVAGVSKVLCADAAEFDNLLAENVARGLTVNPEVVRRNLAEHLPFMATETILMHATARGGDRQELHERIRQHSMAAATRMKEEGADADLLDRIAQDDAFGLDRDALGALVDPRRFVGRAPEQVARFLEKSVKPALEGRETLAIRDPDIHV